MRLVNFSLYPVGETWLYFRSIVQMLFSMRIDRFFGSRALRQIIKPHMSPLPYR